MFKECGPLSAVLLTRLVKYFRFGGKDAYR